MSLYFVVDFPSGITRAMTLADYVAPEWGLAIVGARARLVSRSEYLRHRIGSRGGVA